MTKLDKKNNEKKKVEITIGSDEHWDWIEKQFAKISDETMTTDIPTTTLESILFLMLGVFIHIERDLTLQTIALQEIAEVLKPKEKEDSIPTLIEIANRYENLKHTQFPDFYLLSKEEQEKIDKKTVKYMEKEVEYWDKKAKEQEGDRMIAIAYAIKKDNKDYNKWLRTWMGIITWVYDIKNAYLFDSKHEAEDYIEDNLDKKDYYKIIRVKFKIEEITE